MNTVLPFVSPLLKHHLPNLSSLFQMNVRAHASPGPRDYLCRAVTHRECLALDPPCSSRLKDFSYAGSRFPVACLSGSVSIGFPRACLSLRVVTGSDNSPNFLEYFSDPLISMLKTNCCWNR